MYDLEDALAELLDQRFNLGPEDVDLWVIDYDDAVQVIENLKTALLDFKKVCESSLDNQYDVRIIDELLGLKQNQDER